MKVLLTIICLCCLCSCSNKWSGGTGGPSAHIDVSSTDESAVIQSLESWLTDHGYETRTQSWEELTGDGAAVNNDGEVVYPVSFVKDLSELRGHIAFGVASSTDSHKYVTVFHDAKFTASGQEALDKIEEEVNQEILALQNFVDTDLTSPPDSE